MEVYFVDIGRGTSNLILLGQSRAIVIDCGEHPDSLLQLMERFRVEEIAWLIVSHNHDDHVGGASGILTAYEGRIERLCLVWDGKLKATNLWRKVRQGLQDNTISLEQLVRLEREDTPKMIYREVDRDLSLEIVSPFPVDNFQAVDEGQPNATSGVLILSVGDRRIVFAGDSTIRQWRRIRETRGRPIDCDILSVPHHAGLVGEGLAELQWLYTEGVRPQHALVSVATSNTYKHPRPEVIRTLTSNGATVVCTQITSQCCDSLESHRLGVLAPRLPGQSRPTTDLTGAGNSRNVACGGTMVAEIVDSRLTLHRIADHQAAVNRLSATVGGHPLCRS